MRLLLCALLAIIAAGSTRAAEFPELTGDLRVHDPSVIVEDGHWVSFQTGAEGFWRGAVLLKTSPDGLAWKNAGGIGKGLPAWAEAENGYRSQHIWAPSVSKRDGVVYLYYSISSFGLSASVIGLMTNADFDPQQPDQGWQDQGLVLKSGIKSDWNAIDPYRIDTPDGRAWLSYGSYWTGIKMRELDPVTGKLLAPDTPVIDLASRGGAGIEASSILLHEGRYYLFVSFDQCCRAVDSTYRIMVGRADAVTGPYLDRNGTPMMEGAATELQAGRGRHIGPGGQEPVFGAPQEMLVYHYYDRDNRGAPTLEIVPIGWTSDGWPELPQPPE